MKTIKFNFLLVIMALGVFTFSSCEDEFTEEDFLQMQADLAADQQAFDLEKLILEYSLIRDNDSAAMVFAQQLAAYTEELKDAQEEENLEALRQAGLIVSYTLTVENQGGAPIDVAAVSVGGNNPVGRLDLVTSGGEVVIEDMVVGASPVTITATGYVGVAFIVNFGTVNSGDEFVTLGERIYPIGRNEASRITLVSASNGTTATVSGVATIETDVTNLTPEVPQNVTVVAYLNGTANPFSGFATSGPSITDFRFIGEGIGSAVVDNTTGAWSMVLPANEGGINYTFIVPEVTANQTIAIDERNEVAIAPEYAVVPARFGPSSAAAQAVSAVSGARAVFTAPPAQGTGFTFTFTQVQAALGTGQNTFLSDEEQLIGNTLYRLTSRGSGLSSSPTGTAAGGIATGGTNATFTTAIAGRITGLNIAAAGTGYAVGNTVTVVVIPRDVNANSTTSDINNDGNNDNNPVNNDGSSLSFTVTVASVGGGGEITGITLPTTGIGFGADAFFGFGVTQHVVTSVTTLTGVGINANFTVGSVNARVTDVNVATGGSLYTSAPTSITFTGGNALGGTPTLPALTAVVTGFNYNIAPSGGTGYSVLPAMSYNYSPSPVATSGDQVVQNVTTFTIIDGATTTTLQAILPEFTLAAGVPVRRNSGLLTYQTPLSFSVPVAVITPIASTIATATVNVSSAAATLGQVGTGFGSPLANVTNGSGYAGPFTVTIEPSIATAPGSGATVTLSGFGNLTANLEAQWNGSNATATPGSGYLPNLNRSGTVNFAGINAFTVVSGASYIRNITYGTGNRLQNVD